jgi:UDP-N-acetylglucosamine 4-epimerase
MENHYPLIISSLQKSPKKWMVTGVAGFIGSNLLETLLNADQEVIGVDNFSTGHHSNLADVEQKVGKSKWQKFKLIEGDLSDQEVATDACIGVNFVIHQAALGSVPRSIEQPLASHQANVDGFVNILWSAHKAGIKRFVYASSSSVYGDSPELPKRENVIGNPLSPYAVTKLVNEIYAANFSLVYGIETVGLRYFNVFGPRQDPAGAYAAVIPKWIGLLLDGAYCNINGDGETSRDFCYIDNVVAANILAATTPLAERKCRVFNVAAGEQTTLNQLYQMIVNHLNKGSIKIDFAPIYQDFRAGDIRHSLANLDSICRDLGYFAETKVNEGLAKTVNWFVESKK